MIYVFSGSGMSRRVAAMIGDIPGTRGFVLPVYGWRLPRKARRDIRRSAYAADGTFTWAVFTCGDDAGFIDRDLERELGFQLDAAYTVVMPDTYLGLPGFRLDAPDEFRYKLASATSRAAEIRRRLLAREKTRDMKRGLFPRLKTSVIGRVFDRFLVTDRFWRVDPVKCLACGKCAENCPCGSIGIDAEGRPRWKHDGSCSLCFRCYHACPGDAIELSVFTRGKGRLGAEEH